MSDSIESAMKRRLSRRMDRGNLRSLNNLKGAIDFSSNDYLGLSRHPKVISAVNDSLRDSGCLGSTASRLSSGNSHLATAIEKSIAAYHGAEGGLLFSSGYLANVGLMSSLLSQNDLCLYDERIHMSMRDGIKLSKVRAHSLRHNDLSHLEETLAKDDARGHKVVVIESVYSCCGSVAPLNEIVSLCDRYHASLIIDEAHATGVLGPQGRGLSNRFRSSPSLLATVHTLGKAIGVSGAIVLGSSLLKSFLLNFCNTQIYTTMLPYLSLHAIAGAYKVLPSMDCERDQLCNLIQYFKFKAGSLPLRLQQTMTPIQSILTDTKTSARELSHVIQQNGIDVRPMTFPTVPHGKDCLRICLHAYNTFEEIDLLLETLMRHL